MNDDPTNKRTANTTKRGPTHGLGRRLLELDEDEVDELFSEGETA